MICFVGYIGMERKCMYTHCEKNVVYMSVRLRVRAPRSVFVYSMPKRTIQYYMRYIHSLREYPLH